MIHKKPPKLRTAIFDIETDGLLDTLTTCHILCIEEFETGKRFTFIGDDDIRENGLALLEHADMVAGHNILDFDLRALAQLYPEFEISGRVRDTLVMTRVMFSHQKELDFRLHERGKLPSEYIGRHSLDSWGFRMGKYKGEYSKEREREAKKLGIVDEDEIRKFVWGTPTQAMYDYCENDVDVTVELWKMLLEQQYPEQPIIFEHQVAEALIRQEDNGFPFNVEQAEKLEAELNEMRDRIKAECETHFPSRMEVVKNSSYGKMRDLFNEINWELVDNEIQENLVYDHLALGTASDKPLPQFNLPKKTLRYKDVARGDRTAGVPYTPVYLKEFNPGSRQQVAQRLIELGWKPEDFTETGQPQVNEITLKNAAKEIPIAGILADYFGVTKTLGQLSEGDNGWLKLVTPEGKIHHHVNPCGAVTGRCTHASPNLGQVPAISKVDKIDENGEVVLNDKGKAVKVPLLGRAGGWGLECRSLFYTKPPHVMMGSDLSGIELRCLAHYMAEFDDGEYGKIILKGDIHEVNRIAAGLSDRDQAKTMIYACLTMDIQVLTAGGYKYYHQLSNNEAVWSYNTSTEQTEYCPITEKVFYRDADIWTVVTDQGNIRCTPNHRWYVMSLSDSKLIVKTTDELYPNQLIMMDKGKFARIVNVINNEKTEDVWCIGTTNQNFYCKSPDGYTGITGNTLYGAGPAKIGSIVLPYASEREQEMAGKEILDRFMRNTPALKQVMKKLKQEARRGFITGIDGRRLYIRAQHAALNTLLQNAGAMIAKKWYLLFDEYMEEKGYIHSWGQDYAMMAFVHDEIQVSVRQELAEIAGETSIEAAASAGDYFGFKLPVRAEFKIGANWGMTH